MKLSFLCSLLAGGLLLAACEKDQIQCDQPEDLSTSAIRQALVERHGVPAQLFTVAPSAGTSTTITTGKGAQITVPAGAFLLPDGTPATGQVQLAVREITTKAEMVLSSMPTVSNGQMLISGGQYYIKATQNSQRLRLKPTARLGIKAPSPANVGAIPMDLFFGVTSSSGVNWLPQSQQNPSTIRLDSLGQGTFYNISLYNDSLGWVNCDRFMGLSPLTSVTTTIGGADPVDYSNTMAFLVFDNFNSAARNSISNGQSTSTIPNIPLNTRVTAVVIRLINGQYYFGKQSALVSANLQLAPALQAMSEADMVAEIRRL